MTRRDRRDGSDGRRGEGGSCRGLDGLLPWTPRRMPRERNSPCAMRGPATRFRSNNPRKRPCGDALPLPKFYWRGYRVAGQVGHPFYDPHVDPQQTRGALSRYPRSSPFGVPSRPFVAGVGKRVGRTRTRTRWLSSSINFQWMLVKRLLAADTLAGRYRPRAR